MNRINYHLTIDQPLNIPPEDSASLTFNYLDLTQLHSITQLLHRIDRTPFIPLQDLTDQRYLFLYHNDGTDEETNISCIACRPSELSFELLGEDDFYSFSLDYFCIIPLIADPLLYEIKFFSNLVDNNNNREIGFIFNNGFLS